MKRILLLILCLLWALIMLPASAAQLLDETGGSVPDALTIYGVTCNQEDVTWQLTDNSIYSRVSLSSWSSSSMTLELSLGGDDVSAIWIRNGDYSSEYAYDKSRGLRDVAVEIWYDDGSSRANHLYRLSDVYNTSQTWGDWYEGYQRLALPQTYQGVTDITLTMRNTYTFADATASSPLVVTDLAVSGTSSPSWYEPEDDGYTYDDLDEYTISVVATLTMRMATRTGPCTNYTEPGTFLQEGDKVDVLSQVYDDYNEIWWVQTEFRYNGELMRAYTGAKRVEADLLHVPVEYSKGSVRVNQRVTPWYGPGYEYRRHKNEVASGTYGVVYHRENGWVQVDFYDSRQGKQRRVWIPESMTDSF